jgi:deoxyribonuclease V
MADDPGSFQGRPLGDTLVYAANAPLFAMKIQSLHSWDLTPTEAIALQRELADRVDTRTPLTQCHLVAGADVSYDRFSNLFYAGVVVLRMEDLSIVETQGVVREVTFPYVPGLLSFRETPVLLDVFAKVRSEPDAVILDGHGFSHPRRFGFACHVGLCLNRPSVGCAKSRLIGTYEEPGRKVGAMAPLKVREEIVGQIVRTKARVKPVFVSVGHKIDLRSAVELVLATCRGYRLPEPTRQAHLHVNALRRRNA